MSLTFGRLVMDDPESFPESVGEAIARVGSTPVPGGRSGNSVSATLTSFTEDIGDAALDRERVRRQLRSLINNLPMRLQGVYLAWSEDDEQNGWYVPGAASFDLADVGTLAAGFWRFTGDLPGALVGRLRSHRRGVLVYLRDRRLATTPRDTLRRVYSTNFSGLTARAMTWLPANVTDTSINTGVSITLSAARVTNDGGNIQAVVGGTDLAVVSFDEGEGYRNMGDAIVMDRRSILTPPSTGPDPLWEEVYGPDWPMTANDIPVMENGLVRCRWDTTAQDGLSLDRWTGSAWTERGKILIERIGDVTGYLDTLVSAQVIEWSHDRAVVRAILRNSSDNVSREQVFLTLQRGWTGPRIEVYPPTKAAGTPAGARVSLYRSVAPSGTDTANKFDASLQTTTGSPSFAAGTLGAATFSGENWMVMRRSGQTALIMAVLQSGAIGRTESNTTAYGSARNGLSVGYAAAGYLSVHIGMNDNSTTDAIDAVGTPNPYDGARDLGKEILYDSRSPQTIVAR